MVKKHKDDADATAGGEDLVHENEKAAKEARIIPDGTRKRDGLEREYRTGDGQEWLVRDTYRMWSAQFGREIDPLKAWYLDMGHPPDPDVKEALAELQRK